MSKPSLNSLYNTLARKMSGQATSTEEMKIEEWTNSSPEATDTYNDYKRIWEKKYFIQDDVELVSQKEAGDKIWDAVFAKPEKRIYTGIDISLLLKIAAVFIIFVGSTFIGIRRIGDTTEEIAPISSITKHTLPGHKSIITLRDGTVVSLNSGSKISYLSDFNSSSRIIELEGQAFFEVFSDKTKPFIVKCGSLEVETIGTSFDVSGYNDSPIQVSLVNGSVRLSTFDMDKTEGIVLNPGEYSVVDENNNFIEKGNFDPDIVLGWKDGRLIFYNATIEEIVPRLELWYGVEFHNHSSINSNKPFTGIFEKENLDNILHNISPVMDFQYEIKGNNVQIN